MAYAAVPGICVAALPGADPSVPVSSVTAANGSFSIANLPPARYLVRFDPGCGATGYLTQWYNGAPSKPDATPVIVVAGMATTDVNATMQR